MNDTAISEGDFKQTEVDMRFALANASQDVLIALTDYMEKYRLWHDYKVSSAVVEGRLVMVRAAFVKWEKARDSMCFDK